MEVIHQTNVYHLSKKCNSSKEIQDIYQSNAKFRSKNPNLTKKCNGSAKNFIAHLRKINSSDAYNTGSKVTPDEKIRCFEILETVTLQLREKEKIL